MSDEIITSAYWIKPSQGLVILSHDWELEELPPLELASPRYTLSKLKQADPHVFGELSGYYVDYGQLHFLIYTDDYSYLDLRQVKVYVAGDFNGWLNAIGNPAWELYPSFNMSRPCLRLSLDSSQCFQNNALVTV